MTPANVLAKVVAAVEAEGERLRAEFYGPQGPRGRRGSCPLDREIEERLQVALQALIPARYVAMPSIAYRLARIAAGDGIATVSIHGVNEYDVAAGMALVRAAGGVVLDAQGHEVMLAGNSERRLSGCFAGAPQAAAQLARVDWTLLEAEPRREARVSLGFPRMDKPGRLSRATGCLLGQVIGDSL